MNIDHVLNAMNEYDEQGAIECFNDLTRQGSLLSRESGSALLEAAVDRRMPDMLHRMLTTPPHSTVMRESVSTVLLRFVDEVGGTVSVGVDGETEALIFDELYPLADVERALTDGTTIIGQMTARLSRLGARYYRDFDFAAAGIRKLVAVHELSESTWCAILRQALIASDFELATLCEQRCSSRPTFSVEEACEWVREGNVAPAFEYLKARGEACEQHELDDLLRAASTLFDYVEEDGGMELQSDYNNDYPQLGDPYDYFDEMYEYHTSLLVRLLDLGANPLAEARDGTSALTNLTNPPDSWDGNHDEVLARLAKFVQ